MIFGSVAKWTKSNLETIKASYKDSNIDDFIYLQSVIMTADEPNGNGDFFPKDEMVKAYKSYIGKPVDYNHDVSIVLGKIIDAIYVEGKDGAHDNVELIVKINKKAPEGLTADEKTFYATLIDRIENEDLGFMSLEAYAENAECPFCASKFPFAEPCEHIANYLNKKIKAKDGSDFHIYRIDRDITFVGAGIVENPADKNAEFKTVLAKKKENILDKISANEFLTILDEINEQDKRAEETAESLDKTLTEPIMESELSNYLDKRLTSAEIRKISEILMKKEKLISKKFNAHVIKLDNKDCWLVTSNGVPVLTQPIEGIWPKNIIEDENEKIDGVQIKDYSISDNFKKRMLMALQTKGENYLKEIWKQEETKQMTVESALKIELKANEANKKALESTLITANKDEFKACVESKPKVNAVEGINEKEAIEVYCFKKVVGIKASLNDIFEKNLEIEDSVVGGKENFKAWLEYKNTGKWPSLLATRVRIKIFANEISKLDEENKEVLVKASNLLKFGFDIKDVEKYNVLASEKDLQKLQKYGMTTEQIKKLFEHRFGF